MMMMVVVVVVVVMVMVMMVVVVVVVMMVVVVVLVVVYSCVLKLLCEREVYSVPHKRYLNFSRRQRVVWSCGMVSCSLA
jgi:hypothetical protein